MQGHHEAYVLGCQSPEEMEDWMAAIRDSVLSNPLHQLIATRAKHKLVEKEKEKEKERERESEKEKDKGMFISSPPSFVLLVYFLLLFQCFNDLF